MMTDAADAAALEQPSSGDGEADMGAFYTVQEFLGTFRISRATFYRAVNAGQLRITKIGRATRVTEADAQAWINSLPTVGGA
jgi:excisionase family DNA binding protein